MLDPLTTAASVATLIALAGTTSKALYQFYRSIYDAPNVARDLLSGLYALNAALSQIQECLLRKNFVAATEDEQVEALMDCLTNCTAALDLVRSRVDASGLAAANKKTKSRAWASVKASFNEKQMQGCLSTMERSKTTLLLILQSFAA